MTFIRHEDELLHIPNWKFSGKNLVPSREEQIHKLLYIPEMEYHIATKINDILVSSVTIKDHKRIIIGVSMEN